MNDTLQLAVLEPILPEHLQAISPFVSEMGSEHGVLYI
jgi:hypothetical protein